MMKSIFGWGSSGDAKQDPSPGSPLRTSTNDHPDDRKKLSSVRTTPSKPKSYAAEGIHSDESLSVKANKSTIVTFGGTSAHYDTNGTLREDRQDATWTVEEEQIMQNRESKVSWTPHSPSPDMKAFEGLLWKQTKNDIDWAQENKRTNAKSCLAHPMLEGADTPAKEASLQEANDLWKNFSKFGILTKKEYDDRLKNAVEIKQDVLESGQDYCLKVLESGQDYRTLEIDGIKILMGSKKEFLHEYNHESKIRAAFVEYSTTTGSKQMMGKKNCFSKHLFEKFHIKYARDYLKGFELDPPSKGKTIKVDIDAFKIQTASINHRASVPAGISAVDKVATEINSPKVPGTVPNLVLEMPQQPPSATVVPFTPSNSFVEWTQKKEEKELDLKERDFLAREKVRTLQTFKLRAFA